jgi:hypothetical protein
VDAPGVDQQLLDESLGVRSQESARVPGDAHPSTYWYPALDKRHGPDARARDLGIGGEDREAVPRLNQRDHRVKRAALQEHTRSEVRDLTRGIKPHA